ncbi:MAG: XRE family transcriptional regulator [Candidatus Brocadiia bacterium]
MGVGERLKYARERSGLTQQQVRQRTDIGESSISEFERGKREPKLSQLQMLAEVYRRSLSFFLAEGALPQEAVLWREEPTAEAAALEAEFLKLCEQYHNLEVWCDDRVLSSLPEVTDGRDEFTYGEAEALACKVRGDLQLGDRPGHELLRVLEEVCGVKVFHREFQPTGTAASTRSETFGHAVLLNAANVRWRRNFDLAHELFHLLTWDVFRSGREAASTVAGEDEEKLATCFARHLLMPADAVRVAVGRRTTNGKVSFEGLYDIARQFDVSVDALLWHMHFLYGRTPDEEETTRQQIERVKRLGREYGQRDDTRPPKWPARYHALAVRALRRGEMSIGRFAEYLEISRQEAMTYIEREAEDEEEIQLTPA